LGLLAFETDPLQSAGNGDLVAAPKIGQHVKSRLAITEATEGGLLVVGFHMEVDDTVRAGDWFSYQSADQSY
jgi:hypothetical protein